jgi:uncharacterized protein (TIGR02466 family)
MNTYNESPFIYNLFPVPVVEYGLDRSFTEEELSYIENADKEVNLYNSNSIETKILEQPRIKNINLFVQEKLEEYFRNVYQPNSSVELYITQSWINYSSVGQSHHKHSHPNSIVSGVLYILADKDVDEIVFYRDDPSIVFHIPTDNFNVWNSGYWKVPVSSGRLLLFPSTLHHSVDKVLESEKRKQRISLSFNSFIRGNIGNKKEYTELFLG